MVVNSANPNGNRNLPNVPPFPPGYRASGVLLHVTSLPSRYGIGDVGPAAMKWIDLLHAAGVEYVLHSGVSVYLRDPDGARIELIADPLCEMYGNKVL